MKHVVSVILFFSAIAQAGTRIFCVSPGSGGNGTDLQFQFHSDAPIMENGSEIKIKAIGKSTFDFVATVADAGLGKDQFSIAYTTISELGNFGASVFDARLDIDVKVVQARFGESLNITGNGSLTIVAQPAVPNPKIPLRDLYRLEKCQGIINF